jgi:2-keto-4-pentenoate hydratase/2-oxohepta-3-ene-1,7-dioic acid hydratase in catechol pathway
MRLVTYTLGSGAPRVGIMQGQAVVDPDRVLRAAAEMRHRGAGDAAQLPTEMVAFFQAGQRGRDLAALALELAAADGPALSAPDGEPAVLPAEAVRLLAPVPRPRRIRDYLTYNAHAAGSGLDVSAAFTAMPICYKCNTETVIGPGEPLLWPSYTEQLDFELELGFFTSGGGVNLSRDQAADLIAGVTIFNDVSARDIQFFEMSLGIGPSKGKDSTARPGRRVLLRTGSSHSPKCWPGRRWTSRSTRASSSRSARSAAAAAWNWTAGSSRATS